jgi:hypothetical protein
MWICLHNNRLKASNCYGLWALVIFSLQETKEQYRNKKLLNSLLQLHREVRLLHNLYFIPALPSRFPPYSYTLKFCSCSPRLAACAADLSFMFPTFAVGFGVVCHLITSALACWPLYNWAPGLFHHLLENVEATNVSVPLGPKAAFSLLCLLVSIFAILVHLGLV